MMTRQGIADTPWTWGQLMGERKKTAQYITDRTMFLDNKLSELRMRVTARAIDMEELELRLRKLEAIALELNHAQEILNLLVKVRVERES